MSEFFNETYTNYIQFISFFLEFTVFYISLLHIYIRSKCTLWTFTVPNTYFIKIYHNLLPKNKTGHFVLYCLVLSNRGTKCPANIEI